MEKICIVKLRKNLTRPIAAKTDQRAGSLGDESGRVMNLSSFAEEQTIAGAVIDEVRNPVEMKVTSSRTVSLPLNEEQTRSFQSNRYIQEIVKDNNELAGTGPGVEPFVLKFQFDTIAPLRMLKPHEAMQMLGISRSFLNSLAKRGELKSYKIGRLRRYMLDDILSYLEKSCDCKRRSTEKNRNGCE